MKKVVLKLDLHDDKCRQKAMKTASGLSGVDSIALDKDQKLTIIGDIDPVAAARKLKKICHTEIIPVGPAKEPEKKKEEPKKDEPKKPAEPKIEPGKEFVYAYRPLMPQYHYPVPNCYTCGKSLEDEPKKPAEPKIEPANGFVYEYHPQIPQFHYPVPYCYTYSKSVVDDPKKPADPKIDEYHPQKPQCHYPVPDCYTHGKSVEEDPNGCVIC